MTTRKRSKSKPKPPVRYTPKREIWLLLLLVHIGMALLFVLDRSSGTDAALSGFPLDDTWIHMVYAKNLAQYGLPYYNHGVVEAGFTSPLWLVFGALGHLVAFVTSLSPVLTMKILGVLFAWLASVAIFEICRHFTDLLVSSVLCGLYVATIPAMAFSQVSGMEICLAACLSGWAIWYLLRDRFLLVGILLGLGAITRPESTILSALVALLVLLSRAPKSQRAKFNRVPKLLLPTVILLLLWSVLCLVITGHPMPNTYYAKFTSHDVIGGFSRIMGEMVLGLPTMFLFSGVLLYVVGVLHMLRARRKEMALLIIIYPWFFLFAIAASRNMPPQSGLYYYWLRYVVPGLPFIFIPLAAGFEFLWNRAKRFARGRSKKSIMRFAYIAVTLLVILTWIKLPGQLKFRSSQFAWNCQNMNEVQVELGKWVNENTPSDAVLAVNDAGALRYFGKRNTIDLVGLNNQNILFNRQLAAELRWNPLTMMRFLKSENARYLIIFPSWFDPLVRSQEFQNNFKLVHYLQSKNYTICAAPQDLMAVYLLEH